MVFSQKNNFILQLASTYDGAKTTCLSDVCAEENFAAEASGVSVSLLPSPSQEKLASSLLTTYAV